MAFSVSYIYQISDQYSAKLNKIRQATKKFTRGVGNAQTVTKGFSDKIAKMRGSLAIAAAAIGGIALFPVNEAMKFETAMADVRKVVDFKTPAQFEAIKKEIMDTGEAMGRLPTKIAAIVAAGGRLGIPVEKLGNFTKLASRTSVAFDIMEEMAGDALASITDKLGLTITKTGNLMDAVNFIADNSSAKAAGMIEIIGRLSGTMKTIEMPPELIAAWAGLADRVEVTPRLAASGMKMMMRAMKGMPGMMEKLLKAPSKTMSDYLKQLAKIDKTRLPDILEKRFGAEAAGFIEKLVGKIGLLDEALGLVADKTRFAGSMQRELEKKLATAAVKIKQVKVAFINMAIIAGTAMLPVIKRITPILMKIGKAVKLFAKEHPGLMKMAIVAGIIFAAFSLALIPIGFMAAGISALLSPAAAIIALISGIVVSVAALASENKGLMNALKKLWGVVSILLEPFEMIWDLFSGLFSTLAPGISYVDFLTGAISGLADALQFLLSPLKAFINFSKEFGKGNIGAAFGAGFEALKKGYLGIVPEFMGGTAGALPTPAPISQESVSAQNAKATAGTLNGKIVVAATGGAQVKKAEMETSMPGNLGLNMAPAGVF